MNKLPLEKRVQILSMLVEGSSMRSVSRVVGVSINTVVKMLIDAGKVCEAFHDANVHDVPSRRVQADEIWSFCFAKEKNASVEMKAAGTAGDVWTWTAIDSDNKLIITWTVGNRDTETGTSFTKDLAARVADRIQLTSDGFAPYRKAVAAAFGDKIDFAQLVKIYKDSPIKSPERRYSPAICIGAHKDKVSGKPAMHHVSTSHVERSNLSMRMGMRRFTRLTNAHSKKIENHCHALALYFMAYNWVRPHGSLGGKTPAMACGLAAKPMTMADIVKLIDRAEQTERLGIYSK
jgi:IS1 family transposase